jgi:hypothetical protein
MKAVTVFMIWISFAGLFTGAVFLTRYHDEIVKENYYESYRFTNEFRNFINSVFSDDKVQKLTESISESTFDKYSVTRRTISLTVNFKNLVINTKTGECVTNLEIYG